MTLEQAVKAIESRFTSVEHHDKPLWIESKYFPFAAIVSGGEKEEGGRSPAWCATEDIAVNLWHDAALKYMSDKTGKTLAWRERPSVDWVDFCDRNKNPIKMCRVYSRMVVRSLHG